VVVLGRPLSLLWQALYMYQQVKTATLIDITVVHIAIYLLVPVLLGNNRLRALISATFAFSIVNLAHFPGVYFLSVVIIPLTNAANSFEAFRKFPQLYYSAIFISNVIIAACCLLAARWLHTARSKPPVKLYVFFNLLFVIFPLIILVCWENLAMIMSLPFLAMAFMGTLFLVVLMFLFYLYTRLTQDNSTTKSPHTETKADEYKRFVQHLSRRELEVIEAILAGNEKQKELSAALNISVNTVKTHLKHIYQTTGVSNITALSSLLRGFSSNSI